jgi:hypothetical protein
MIGHSLRKHSDWSMRMSLFSPISCNSYNRNVIRDEFFRNDSISMSLTCLLRDRWYEPTFSSSNLQSGLSIDLQMDSSWPNEPSWMPTRFRLQFDATALITRSNLELSPKAVVWNSNSSKQETEMRLQCR